MGLTLPIILLSPAINQKSVPNMRVAPMIVGTKNKVTVALHVLSPKAEEDDGDKNRAADTVATQIIVAKAMAKQTMARR